MKKYIVLAILSLLFIAPSAHAVKYRGFVDYTFSGNLTGNGTSMGLLTSHGVQFTRCLYFGVGGGGIIGELESSDHLFPIIFANPRIDFFRNRTANFFIDIKAGYAIGEEYKEDKRDTSNEYLSGVYFRPSIGVRFRVSSVVGINLAIAYQPVKKYMMDNDWDVSVVDGKAETGMKHFLGLSIGVDF